MAVFAAIAAFFAGAAHVAPVATSTDMTASTTAGMSDNTYAPTISYSQIVADNKAKATEIRNTLDSKLQLIRITNNSSGISVSVPVTSNKVLNPDGSETVTLGADYWNSFNFSSTTNKYVNEEGQTSVSVGIASQSSNHCSIQNRSERGDDITASTTMIDGYPFYTVTQSGYGMNHGSNVNRYVQLLDGGNCRYAEFEVDYTSPDMFDDYNANSQLIDKEIGSKRNNFYTVKDFSDSISASSIASTSPSITVLSPNGGETWKAGTSYQVKWQSNNFSNSPASSVNVNLVLPNGTTCFMGTAPINQGQLTITPMLGACGGDPTHMVVAGQQYKINLQIPIPSDPDNMKYISDTSDDYFTITN